MNKGLRLKSRQTNAGFKNKVRKEDLMNKGLRRSGDGRLENICDEVRKEDLMNKGLRLSMSVKASPRGSTSSVRKEDLMNKGLRRHAESVKGLREEEKKGKKKLKQKRSEKNEIYRFNRLAKVSQIVH